MPSRITRLSATEVANISPLQTSQKIKALHAVEVPKVFWGYNPVVNALPKLLLAASPLFGNLPGGSDEDLIEQIRKACRSGPVQAAANVAVAEAIVSWRNENRVRGVVIHPEPYRSSADAIRFCADVAVIADGQLYVINLDCRSQMNLGGLGKEFMKSIMHHTALIGDLKGAKVAILRTPKISARLRKASLEVLEGQPTYTLNQVDQMVMETYSIWETILMARRSEQNSETGIEDGLI